ncbi:MAG: HAD hydrolase-like protein, partial [Campylobacter sp.]
MSKVIIFDMDGTLINSTQAICETINYMRLGLNLTPLSYSYIIEVINNPAKNYMIEFYGVDKISNNMMKIFEDEYQKNYFLHAKVYDEAMAVM